MYGNLGLSFRETLPLKLKVGMCWVGAGGGGLYGSPVSRDHQPGPGAPQEPQRQEGIVKLIMATLGLS